MNIFYCRVGWMDYYQGTKNGDYPRNGGSYNLSQIGHEVYNFKASFGTYYGYVEPGGKIKIENLGAKKTDDFVDDVLVVWTATRPEGGTYIVGWYENATVYREIQHTPDNVLADRDDFEFLNYYIQSKTATLLDDNERTYKIDSMGQSLIWYGDEEANIAVLNYILSVKEASELFYTSSDVSDLQSNDKYVEAAALIDYLYQKNGTTKDFPGIDYFNSIRNRFNKMYSLDALMKYKDSLDIWDNVWEHGQGGMIHALRNNEQFRIFGSATSSDVKGLPVHQNRNGDFFAGPGNAIKGMASSLAYGMKFRNKFVNCVKAIANMQLETVDDFVQLENYLQENLDGKAAQMWVHKYLHMLYPEKFSQFHSSKFKKDVLCALGIIPVKSYYGMAGQLYQIKKHSTMNDFTLFAQVIYLNYPGIGRDDVYLINLKANNVANILSWIPETNVDVETEFFTNLYDNPRFQKQSSEDERNHLFVVRFNDRPLGILDCLSTKKTGEKVDFRMATWHSCFSESDVLSSKKEDTTSPLDNLDDLILVYSRYYAKFHKTSLIEKICDTNVDEYIEDFEKIEESLSMFTDKYPKDWKKLQENLSSEGIEGFVAELSNISKLYYGEIDESSPVVDASAMAPVAMVILQEQQPTEDELSEEWVSRLLGIYYPDKYTNIEEEYLDLVLEELEIPYSSEQKLIVKQTLVHNWINEKIMALDERPIVLNYIFNRAMLEWLGIGYKQEASESHYYHLHNVEEEVRKEFEKIDIEERIALVDDIEDSDFAYYRKPQEVEYVEMEDAKKSKALKRDPVKRIHALMMSGYKCEINPTHNTFISRKTGRPYLETHHFIPLEFQDDFKYSLDVEENIVCLCSNCHNEIHYGKDNAKLVSLLYEKRKELLRDVCLNVTEADLLQFAYRTYQDE